MAQLAQRINMRQLPPIIFPHTSSPSISSLARYARLTTHFQWYPVMVVIDMIGMTVMSQAPRNSSTGFRSSGPLSHLARPANHLLHISQYRVYLIFVLYTVIYCRVTVISMMYTLYTYSTYSGLISEPWCNRCWWKKNYPQHNTSVNPTWSTWCLRPQEIHPSPKKAAAAALWVFGSGFPSGKACK